MFQDFKLRLAVPGDIPEIFSLIQALAEYERLSHEVTGNAQMLEQHIFGEHAYAEVIVAESLLVHPAVEASEKIVGFALFFHNYSTFLTQPGLYLEDLFVLPEYRGQGIGKSLIIRLAQIAVERNCGRVEWSVLDWNQPAIDFYEHMGAVVQQEWRICRVTGDSLARLSQANVF